MVSKKYDIKTINFGERGHPARLLVEKYIKKNGKNELSKLIRKLVIIYLKNDPEYSDWKKQAKILEYKEVKKQLAKSSTVKAKIERELETFGVDPEDVI